MAFFSRFNPRVGVADFWQEFRRPNPYRWRILAVSMAITGTLIYAFTQEGGFIPPERPTVSYITTFLEGRTDDEIIASNIANQELQDERQAARERTAERKRELFRTLGNVSGMDVEQIEREAAEVQTREDAAAEAERQRMMGGQVADPAQ